MEIVEINCRCKDCTYSAESPTNVFYCYFWDYEQGMSPNTVEKLGFCNNGEQVQKTIK